MEVVLERAEKFGWGRGEVRKEVEKMVATEASKLGWERWEVRAAVKHGIQLRGKNRVMVAKAVRDEESSSSGGTSESGSSELSLSGLCDQSDGSGAKARCRHPFGRVIKGVCLDCGQRYE